MIETMDDKQQGHSYINTILVMAFFLTSLFIFINFVFLNKEDKMLFPQYVAPAKRIGNDFRIMLNFTHTYFVDHKSAYINPDPEYWFIGNGYPPLFTYFLYPFILLNVSPRHAYIFIVGLILLSFLWISLILPMIFLKQKVPPTVLLFTVITGMLSYGMQFALERGQLDIITMAMSLTAIYVFWFIPKLRLLSYLLLFIAFQFKMYPIIFFICLVDGLHNWKFTLKRGLGIALAIAASLFVMGTVGFQEFLRALTAQVAAGVYPKDHGFNTGVEYIVGVISPNLSMATVTGIKIWIIGVGLIALGLVFWVYLRNYPVGGFFPPLIFACTLGAMVLFPASKDYKLCLLVGVFGIYLLYIENKLRQFDQKKHLVIYGIVFILALCYCTTLYSFIYRPLILQNSFPILYLMLVLLPVVELIFLKYEGGSLFGKLRTKQIAAQS